MSHPPDTRAYNPDSFTKPDGELEKNLAVAAEALVKSEMLIRAQLAAIKYPKVEIDKAVKAYRQSIAGRLGIEVRQ